MHVTTIGLDIAQHWFQLHGSTPRARSSSDENYAASEVVEFFRNLEPCLVRAHFRAPTAPVRSGRSPRGGHSPFSPCRMTHMTHFAI